MTFCRWGKCCKCGKESNLYNGAIICSSCREEELKEERDKYLDEIKNSLSLEERVRRIEEILYYQARNSYTVNDKIG